MDTPYSEQFRMEYEELLKSEPENIRSLHFLGCWHLKRRSYHQARTYMARLAGLRRTDPDAWFCLCVCALMSGDFDEGHRAMNKAKNLVMKGDDDVRMKFCIALDNEKQKEKEKAAALIAK